jgi:hypothetical protein
MLLGPSQLSNASLAAEYHSVVWINPRRNHSCLDVITKTRTIQAKSPSPCADLALVGKVPTCQNKVLDDFFYNLLERSERFTAVGPHASEGLAVVRPR